MEWQFVVALVVMVPVILFPAAFVWYINISGIMQVWQESRARERRRARTQPQ